MRHQLGTGRDVVEHHGESDLRSHLVGPEGEVDHDAEVPTTASDRPEQVRILVVAGGDELARRQDDLSGQQIVTAQPPLPVEPTDATAERQAADTGRRHHAPGTASPNTWVSRSTCPHVAPPWTRTVWLAGSTQTPFMSRRSSTRPPSTVP